MPQPDAPPDFAALWQLWRYLKHHTDLVQTDHARIAEGNAARALLDALTTDPTLRDFIHEYDYYVRNRQLYVAGQKASYAVERLLIMGLLHGPEEGGDGG